MLLQLTNLSVTYPDGFEAVRHANLELPERTVIALVGASGSGKSSLLRGVAGLESTSGSVKLRGEEITGIPPYRRDCGMVFQEGLLFPHRNVGRNVAYGLEGRRGRARLEPDETVQSRVVELLELVGLEGYENREITTLSGGQAQRVALARALAPRPSLMLLDEPLSALDQDLRAGLAAELRRILTATGMGALYVTHDRLEAETVADAVVTMTNGHLAAA